MNLNLKTEELESGDRFKLGKDYVELVTPNSARMLHKPLSPIEPVTLPSGYWDVIRTA